MRFSRGNRVRPRGNVCYPRPPRPPTPRRPEPAAPATVLPGILSHRLLLAATAVAALMLPIAAGAEWITNSIALDPGACGRNLQVGSDRTASTSATPTFMLQGDG